MWVFCVPAGYDFATLPGPLRAGPGGWRLQVFVEEGDDALSGVNRGGLMELGSGQPGQDLEDHRSLGPGRGRSGTSAQRRRTP